MKRAREHTHVAIIGDAFMDVVCGPIERMPRWGGDVEAPSIKQMAGGSALNVAVGIGSLIRGDEKDCLSVDSAVGTGCCIVLTGHEDRGFVTNVGATGKLDVPHLQSVTNLFSPEKAEKSTRFHVHISGFYSCPALQPNLLKFIRELRASHEDLTISFDTNCDASDAWESGVKEILQEVDIFLPNEVEARGISKEADLEKAADVLAKLVRQAVIITCGGDGSILQGRAAADEGKPVQRTKVAPGISPIDFTGAGDAFDAGFIYRWAVCGGSLEDGVVSGSCTGGLCTQSVGANSDLPSAKQLDDLESTAKAVILSK